MFEAAARTLRDAVAARVFPCGVAEVGTSGGPAWRYAAGRLTFDDGAADARDDTIFDLASLTKVMATGILAMRAVESGAWRLDDRIADRLPSWRGTDREHVTVEDLLTHSSGLTGHLPFYRDCEGRLEFEHAIANTRLDYPPRTRALYSDLGFILLGFMLEDTGRADLATQFDHVRRACGAGDLSYAPPRAWHGRTAPTGVNAWRGRLLVGEVHDDNAWALGGLAGHAGLFGSAPAVGAFARWVLAGASARDRWLGAATWRRSFTRSAVPGSSRALAWDTMLPASSCGPAMHPGAVGHTGFTGTSLWIDVARDAYFVLLSNRVFAGDQDDRIRDVRRAFHEAAIAAVFGTSS